MPDAQQLPHLLRLVDDDSQRVQQIVARALASFGPSLEQQLSQLQDPPDEARVQQVRDLLARHIDSQGSAESASQGGAAQEDAGTEALFVPGQLVKHRRYGYRGVVVAFDPTCQADDDWYFSNQNQPDRYQPWYHVLVHGGQHTTYAAQTSLEADDSNEQVAHPLTRQFFSAFTDGRYVRNDTPWPG